MSRVGSNIYKRKDGRWEGRYIKGYNETGRAVYGFVYAKTYQEIKNKLSLSKSETMMNTDSKLTFAEVSEKWLFNISLKVKQSTYARYLFVLERHILPILGGYKLYKLTSADIDRFTQDKLSKGKIDRNGGLSAKTVHDILSVIKSVINFAKKEKLTNMQDLTVTYPKIRQSETRILTRQEQAIFENYLYREINLFKLGILISLYTGLRIGEICALQWKNISVLKSTISVTQTIQRMKNTDKYAVSKTKILIDTPKSKSSVRDIPVPNFIMNDIIRFVPKPFIADTYFLTGREDKFTEPRIYQNFFAKCVKSSEITPINYHVTRHTFATRCVESGFDIKSLSEILGHSSVSITLNRYVHSSFEQKQKNMMKIERVSMN